MNSETQESLDWWRENPLTLRPTDVPYERAIRTLGTPDAIVELRKQGGSRWTMYMRDSDQVAVFNYAAIFSMADDYYSGNLIPGDQPLPPDTSRDRVERFATWKCQYAYGFDTAYDKTLFSLQQMLEEYASTLPDFNPSGLPRREYQSGNDPAYTWRYWMRAPMFLRINEGDPKPPPPSHLHPWVIAADKRSRIYRANPTRPQVFSLDGEIINSIDKSEPNTLQRGDIVLVHFVMSIVMTPSAWYTEVIPVELVRVVPVTRLLSETFESGPPLIDASSRPGLMDGERIAAMPQALRNSSNLRRVSNAGRDSVTTRPTSRTHDVENIPPMVLPPALARSSRSSSTSSSIAGIASSVAAMEVDDDEPVVPEGEEAGSDEMLSEPFEDVGAMFDRSPAAPARTPANSASSSPRLQGSDVSRLRRTDEDVGRLGDPGVDLASAKRKRAAGVRSGNSSSRSSVASVASDEDDSLEVTSRRVRRGTGRKK